MAGLIALQEKTEVTKEIPERVDILDITDEVVAFCPQCKTLETLWFTRGGLIRTRKFRQEDSRVYHDCGSNQSCRLFRHL